MSDKTISPTDLRNIEWGIRKGEIVEAWDLRSTLLHAADAIEKLQSQLAAAEEDYAICNTQRQQADAANSANLDTIAELMARLAAAEAEAARMRADYKIVLEQRDEARGLLREVLSGRESLVVDALGCELYERVKKEVRDVQTK